MYQGLRQHPASDGLHQRRSRISDKHEGLLHWRHAKVRKAHPYTRQTNSPFRKARMQIFAIWTAHQVKTHQRISSNFVQSTTKDQKCQSLQSFSPLRGAWGTREMDCVGVLVIFCCKKNPWNLQGWRMVRNKEVLDARELGDLWGQRWKRWFREKAGCEQANDWWSPQKLLHSLRQNHLD